MLRWLGQLQDWWNGEDDDDPSGYQRVVMYEDDDDDPPGYQREIAYEDDDDDAPSIWRPVAIIIGLVLFLFGCLGVNI